MAFFGDGTANEGAFHEALNLAAVWTLPVVFVCENNLYGFSTHYRRTMLLDNIADRAGSYGMPGVTADGMDVAAVYRTAGEAVRRARGGGGPTLLEYKTYRYMGHSRFEASNYRTKEEVAQWKERDPLPRFRQQLVSDFHAPESRLSAIEDGIAGLEAAVRFAETSPDPDPQDYRKYIFSNHRPTVEESASRGGGAGFEAVQPNAGASTRHA